MTSAKSWFFLPHKKSLCEKCLQWLLFRWKLFFSRPHEPQHPFLSSPLCLLCYGYSQPTLNVTWLRCWYSDTIFIAQCLQFYVRPLGFVVTSTRKYIRPVHAQTTMCILSERYHDIDRSTSTGHLSFLPPRPSTLSPLYTPAPCRRGCSCNTLINDTQEHEYESPEVQRCLQRHRSRPLVLVSTKT